MINYETHGRVGSLLFAEAQTLKRMLRLALIITALSVAVPSQVQTRVSPSQQTDREKAVQELKELTFDECEAVLENHTATLERIWAAEFLMHTADGRTTPKAQARAYLRTALPQSISGLCTIEYREIKVSRGKAEMSGRMNINATAPDGTFQPVRYRFNQRLVKRDDRWQVVFLEFSPDAP
ncbi:MAG TPA: nuclear transport factor 2 family protein [Pyrinomonadaceae bacterium]|nr:nuclear transport factor 2 family protein [Pyrinomonadaceae bacterium]